MPTSRFREPIRTTTDGATGIRGDVSSLDDLDRVFATVRREAGSLWTSCSRTRAADRGL